MLECTAERLNKALHLLTGRVESCNAYLTYFFLSIALLSAYAERNNIFGKMCILQNCMLCMIRTFVHRLIGTLRRQSPLQFCNLAYWSSISPWLGCQEVSRYLEFTVFVHIIQNVSCRSLVSHPSAWVPCLATRVYQREVLDGNSYVVSKLEDT